MEILSRVHLPIEPVDDDEVVRLHEINQLDEKVQKSIDGLNEEIASIPRNLKPGESTLTVSIIHHGLLWQGKIIAGQALSDLVLEAGENDISFGTENQCEDPEKYIWVRMNFTEWMEIIDPYTGHSRKDGPSIFTGEPFVRVEWILDENVKTINDGPNKWDGNAGAFWIMDTDGWFYWGEPLACSESETASIGKILKEIKLIKRTPQILDYYIDIHIEAINRDLSDFNNWLLPDMIGDKSAGSYNPGVSEEIRPLFIASSGSSFVSSSGRAIQIKSPIELPRFDVDDGNLNGLPYCIFISDDVYYAAGENAKGQLCNGYNKPMALPEKMMWDANTPITCASVRDMKCGRYTICIQKTDGSWWGAGTCLVNSAVTESCYPVRLMWSETEYFNDTNVLQIQMCSSGFYIWKNDGILYGTNRTYLTWINTSVITNYPGQCVWDKNPTTAIIYASEITQIVEHEGFTFVHKKANNKWYLGNSSSGTLLAPLSDIEGFEAVNGNVKIFSLYNSYYYIDTDGAMWGWGAIGTTTLGNGLVLDIPGFVKLMWDETMQMNYNDFKKMVLGYNEIYVLKNDGTWWAFGSNNNGQLSIGKTLNNNKCLPMQAMWDKDTPMTEDNVADLRVGLNLARFQKKDGTWWSVGWNYHSMLVIGTTDTTDKNKVYPAPMIWEYDLTEEIVPRTLTLVDSPRVDGNYIIGDNIFLGDDNTYYCGGTNTGQMSIGIDKNYPNPIMMMWDRKTPMTTENVAEIKSGTTFKCIKKPDGSWWTVGKSLCNESETSFYPVKMMWDATTQMTSDNMKKMILVDTGGFVLKSDNIWYAWGSGSNYRKFTSAAATTAPYYPFQVKWNVSTVMTETSVKEIFPGPSCTYFLKSSDNLWYIAGGGNAACNGGASASNYPVNMKWNSTTNIDGNTKIVFSTTRNVYLVKPDSSWWAVGEKMNGQLCDGTSGMTPETYPVAMRWSATTTDTIKSVKKYVVGTGAVYVLKTDNNWYGFGGITSDIPVQKSGLTLDYPGKLIWNTSTPMTESNAPELRPRSGYLLIRKPDNSWWGAGSNKNKELNYYETITSSTYTVPMQMYFTISLKVPPDDLPEEEEVTSTEPIYEFPPAPMPDTSKTGTIYLNDDQSIKVNGFTVRMKELPEIEGE